MPLELYSLWHQYPWQLGAGTCVLRTVAAEATAYASVLTIATFSCQQYVAVCHSFRSRLSRSKLARALRNILAIWAVSFAAAAPYGFYTRVNYLTAVPGGPEIAESAWCGFPFNAPTRQWETLMLCSTFLFFVAPMGLISLLYVRICLVLCRASSRSLEHRTDGHRARMQSRKIVIRMLLTVVVAFFVCWAPYHSQRLLFLYVSLYGEWTASLRKINQDLFSLAGCFYYFNSTINPVLYSVMSQRFRVAFRENFCADNPVVCCTRWWRHLRGSLTTSSPSSSRRTPQQAQLQPQHPPAAAAQASLVTNLKDRIARGPAGEAKFPGMSYSDEKRREADELRRPHFSSDPNFSMRLALMCVDFSPSDEGNCKRSDDSNRKYSGDVNGKLPGDSNRKYSGDINGKLPGDSNHKRSGGSKHKHFVGSSCKRSSSSNRKHGGDCNHKHSCENDSKDKHCDNGNHKLSNVCDLSRLSDEKNFKDLQGCMACVSYNNLLLKNDDY